MFTRLVSVAIIALFMLIQPTGTLKAQSFQAFPSEILSIVSNQDGSLLAANTVDSVYIFNSAALSLKQKWAHGQQTPVLLGFHPMYNNVLLMQRQLFKLADPVYQLPVSIQLESYREHHKNYREMPEDSILMWDIRNEKIVNKTTGCLYLQFGKQPGQVVTILNKVFPYQFQGQTNYGSTGCDIETRDSVQRYRTSSKKACRKLVLSPDATLFAATWKDEYKNDTLYFSFTVNHFTTHEALLSLENLTEQPDDFCFSQDAKSLAIAGNWESGGKRSIRIYDLITGKLITDIPVKNKVADLAFLESGATLSFREKNNDWFSVDTRTGRILQRLWSSLAGIDRIRMAIALQQQVVMGGEYFVTEPGKPTGSDKIFLLSKVSLKDLSIYTTAVKANLRSYADSTAFTMQLNDVPAGNDDPVIKFSTDKRVLASVIKNQLQAWQTDKKKKLLQLTFENNIIAIPDRDGNEILVVEKNQQKSGFEFMLHIVSLKNSTVRSTERLQQGENIMEGASYYFDAVADPLRPAVWYCLDGTDQVWQVNGSDLSMKVLASIEKQELRKIKTGSSGEILVLSEGDSKVNNVWVVKEKPEQVIRGSEKLNMLVLPREIWMWNYSYSGDSTIEIWQDKKLVKTLKLPGPVKQVDVTADYSEIMVQYEMGSYNYIQRYVNNMQATPQKTGSISGRFYALKKDELLGEDEGFSSWFENGSRSISWSIKTPQVLDYYNFDVSSNGNFILAGDRVIDLREINQWNIDKYATAALLQDSGKLQWIEIFTQFGYGDKKGGFTLYKYIQGAKDTIKSSSWVAEPKNYTGLSFKHDQLFTSDDKKWAISYTRSGMLNTDEKKAAPMLWDLQSMKGTVVPVKGKYFILQFASDGKTLICHEWNEQTDFSKLMTTDETVFQLQPFKMLQSRKNLLEHKLKQPVKDRVYIDRYNIKWLQQSGDSFKLVKIFYSTQNLKQVVYCKELGKVVAGAESGLLFIWDINGSSSPQTILTVHKAGLERMVLRGYRVYSLAANGEMAITDLSENKLQLLIQPIIKEDETRIAMYTPGGYYRVDPDLMNHLHFVKNNKIYPLSSFELQGNRPDKVYEAIGLADSSFILSLKESWETRIKRAGLNPSEIQLTDVRNRPIVEWNRSGLPVYTRDSLFRLKLNITDAAKNVKIVYVKINGVPLQSRYGLTVQKGKTDLNFIKEIELVSGQNTISIVAVNEDGVESLEETFEIQYEPLHKRKKRLVYAGIGVSAYADTSMNLRFAAKDVNDIAERLQYYADIVDTFKVINERATKEGILGLKKYLQQTSTDDIVILSFSGHGLIQKEKGFFFAPYDMDFDNPPVNGISMEMIEDMLDDIPARKRLLLLDACHSGEEWGNDGSTDKLPEGVTITRPRGIIIDQPGTGSNAASRSSYLLMKELFSDFSRGNGAFMISAAGSNEFAFEGEQWNNGVFTKSFLEALRELQSRASGFSGNGQVRVRELRKLIYEKVSELTNGRQNPTSRQENGWWNWSF